MVGRSDDDLNGEIKAARKKFAGSALSNLFRQNVLSKFKFAIADSVDTAYQVECRAFENFGGVEKLLNRAEPVSPITESKSEPQPTPEPAA